MLQSLDYCIHTQCQFTLSVSIYIVRDGKRKGEGEGWRDRNRESKRVRGRYKSVFHAWLCCYGNKMWAPYSQKSVLVPSSLPSLHSLSQSFITSILSLRLHSIHNLSLSPLPFPPITSHRMSHLCLSLARSLSHPVIPAHPSPLSVRSLPLLFLTLPSVSLCPPLFLFPSLFLPVSLTLTYILFFSRLSWQ